MIRAIVYKTVYEYVTKNTKENQHFFVIDDCSASKELIKKKDMLSYLAFSGRHTQHSVWVLTPKYNSVLKDLKGYDIGMVILDIGSAMETKDMLIKQGLIPQDIMK